MTLRIATTKNKPRGLSRFRKRGWERVGRALYGAAYDKYPWDDLELHIEAREGRRLVGYAALWIDGGVVVIDELLVHEKHRGTGVGHALMQEIESVARKRGAHKLSLETDPKLEPANGFYRAHGFKHEATLPRHYAKRPAVMYGKRLD